MKKLDIIREIFPPGRRAADVGRQTAGRDGGRRTADGRAEIRHGQVFPLENVRHGRIIPSKNVIQRANIPSENVNLHIFLPSLGQDRFF